MAEIIPFRALHYDPRAVQGLENVVTQPYDKISPEMQARYYALSPYNLVRIIRRRAEDGGSSPGGIYEAAAREFRQWLEKGIVVHEREPALYPYYQTYYVPGQPGVLKQRRGFIALLRLEDYANRVVHRHEETLSGPKADRFELLKATRTHYGQIFMLYSDPPGGIENELAAAAAGKPWQHVVDEYRTTHSVWRVTDPALIEKVAAAMLEKKLVIADGHHRYETALSYRDYCRAEKGGDERAEYVMATFVRMETDGLTILPTHRVVYGLPRFQWPSFLQTAARWFEVIERAPVNPAALEAFQDDLARAGRETSALGAYAAPSQGGQLVILRLRRDVDLGRALPDVEPSLARLDVVILHRLLLERALGIDRQAVREEKNLHYVRELEAAIRQVDEGAAQVAFLMNPTPIEAVRDNAFAGYVLPQKSTDFYPKLLSGLTMYRLDNPAGI